jgi:hypothetical protein
VRPGADSGRRHGAHPGQDEAVRCRTAAVCRPMCPGITRDGHPRHPLYVPYTAELMPYRGPTIAE